MTDQERLLGQAVVDFVNAENTDEAAFQHFRKIQQIAGFPPTFAERAKKVFPSIAPYMALRVSEKKLIEKIIEERRQNIRLNEQLKNMNDCYLEDYDWKNMTLFFRQVHLIESLVDGEREVDVLEGEAFELHLDEIEHKAKERFGKTLNVSVIQELRRLMKLGSKIFELKSSLDDSRIRKLFELAQEYERTVRIHRSIGQIQKDLRSILNNIIRGKHLKKNHLFVGFLETYNRIQKSKVYLTNEDLLSIGLPFDEKAYFHLDGFPETEYSSQWPARFRDDLAYCLIEFLISEKNRYYIYRCRGGGEDFFAPSCDKIFIARKLYKTASGLYFCSDACRLKYHCSKAEYKNRKAAAQRNKHGWNPRENVE